MLFASILGHVFVDRSQIKKKVKYLDPENHDLFLLVGSDQLHLTQLTQNLTNLGGLNSLGHALMESTIASSGLRYSVHIWLLLNYCPKQWGLGSQALGIFDDLQKSGSSSMTACDIELLAALQSARIC